MIQEFRRRNELISSKTMHGEIKDIPLANDFMIQEFRRRDELILSKRICRLKGSSNVSS